VGVGSVASGSRPDLRFGWRRSGCPAKRSVGRVPGFLAPTGAAGL